MHLTLNIKEIWESSPLPVLVIVAWSLLWWRGSRRIRLWFVGLAPLVAAVGVVLGLLALGRARPVLCTPDSLRRRGGEPTPTHTPCRASSG